MAFVKSFDGRGTVGQTGSVEIGSGVDDIEAAGAGEAGGVGVKERGICLKMDYAAGSEDTSVDFEEAGRSEAPACFLHLRIGERDPDLRDFAGSEEGVEESDVGAEKGGVRYVAELDGAGTVPEAGAFDVDSDEIAVGISLGEGDGVFAFAATEFKGDRSRVFEEIFVPVAFERESFLTEGGPGVLENATESLDVGEFFEFVFSHET